MGVGVRERGVVYAGSVNTMTGRRTIAKLPGRLSRGGRGCKSCRAQGCSMDPSLSSLYIVPNHYHITSRQRRGTSHFIIGMQQLRREGMAARLRLRDTDSVTAIRCSSSHSPFHRSTVNSGISTVPSKHHAPSPFSTLTRPITTSRLVKCSGTRRLTCWVKRARSVWTIVVWVTDRRRRVEDSSTK